MLFNYLQLSEIKMTKWTNQVSSLQPSKISKFIASQSNKNIWGKLLDSWELI